MTGEFGYKQGALLFVFSSSIPTAIYPGCHEGQLLCRHTPYGSRVHSAEDKIIYIGVLYVQTTVTDHKKTIAARRNKICLTRRGILPHPVVPVSLISQWFCACSNSSRCVLSAFPLTLTRFTPIMHFTLSSVCFFSPSTNTYTFTNLSYHSYLLQLVDILIPLGLDQRQLSVIDLSDQSSDVSFRSEIDQRSPLFMHRRH